MIKSRGLPLWVVKVYRDEAKSGKTARHRDGFQQMLRDIKTGVRSSDCYSGRYDRAFRTAWTTSILTACGRSRFKDFLFDAQLNVGNPGSGSLPAICLLTMCSMRLHSVSASRLLILPGYRLGRCLFASV